MVPFVEAINVTHNRVPRLAPGFIRTEDRDLAVLALQVSGDLSVPLLELLLLKSTWGSVQLFVHFLRVAPEHSLLREKNCRLLHRLLQRHSLRGCCLEGFNEALEPPM